MSLHSANSFVKYRRPKYRWAFGCMAALLCLSTMLPVTVFGQTLLPVVIKLPPSFLRSAPLAKTDASLLGRGAKEGNDVASAVSQIAALRNTEVRASELRGFLPHQFDHHYFRLEATKAGGAFGVTLVVEPSAVLEDNAVNFVVLTEDGMTKFASGIDPMLVKTAVGSPLLFDQVGNRRTALVPGSVETNYTVVVFNNGKLPVTYALQVDGGTLIDDAGQTYSSVTVGAPLMDAAEGVAQSANRAPTMDVTLAKYEGVVKRFGISKPASTSMLAMLQSMMPEHVRARRMSGALYNWQDRHYLNLATDMGGGEIVLTLRYDSDGGLPTHLNFWVMTQDGVRQLVQGGMAQELNMATGLPVAGEPGVYQARLRMAENMLYTVVVFSEGMVEADYTLSVQGGILMDRYGQTREAHAAEMELAALSRE